ncbi:MAG: hypothetical protein AVDCRST_MAG56-7614 [uncultured Cytophagales bacterium]|uniref:Uncharacterized protein n=1 Tax=uncultured Cytophagales bacterium TaxID=158755 RepID=A0A6J4LJR2_9SPHI|nr:MAG: hypothetical protein AVDCRST_MAG56-7614 [uncultured Cytophagales bacterium]
MRRKPGGAVNHSPGFSFLRSEFGKIFGKAIKSPETGEAAEKNVRYLHSRIGRRIFQTHLPA